MTVAKAWALQADLYQAVKPVADSFSLTVYDYAPTKPPAEFLRLDGFSVTDITSKLGEVARHAFEVHHFTAAAGGDTYKRGQARSKQVLAALHAAIMAASLQGARPKFENMAVEPDSDGTTAHGMSRYTLILV